VASVKQDLVGATSRHHGIAACSGSGGIGCEDLQACDLHRVVGGVPRVITEDQHGAGSHDARQVVGGVGPVGRAVEPPEQADTRGHSKRAVQDIGPLRHVDGLPERDALGEFNGVLEARDWSVGGPGIQVVTKWRGCEEDGAREVPIDAIAVGISVVARVVRFPNGARASEEPEEASVAVQRKGHPIGIA
jgi:hypothetical protein